MAEDEEVDISEIANYDEEVGGEREREMQT